LNSNNTIINRCLYFDKNFLFIQKIQEKPANCDERDSIQKLRPTFRKEINETAKNKIGSKPEIDNRLRHIYCYGIQPDDRKEKRPPTVSLNIYYPVEQCK